MTFIPYPGRIQFEPHVSKGVLKTIDGDIIEEGTVLFAHEGSFYKKGDTISFLKWGAAQSPGGEWTVREDLAFCLGKSYE